MSDDRPPEPDADLAAGDVPTGDATAPPPPIDLSEPEPVGAAAVPPMAAPPADVPPAPPVAGDGGGVEPGPERPRVPAPPWKLIAVVVGFLVVGAIAFVVGRSGKDDGGTASSSTTVAPAPVNTADWVSTTDPSGFSVKHPKDWEKLQPSGNTKVLFRMGAKSVLGITAYDVAYNDAAGVIADVMKDAQLVAQPQDTQLGGLPAVVYIFNKDATDNNDAATVVQYFAITKNRMFSLIFAMSPPEEVNRLARTVSAVSKTFESSLEKPPLETATTTAPGATTTPTT